MDNAIKPADDTHLPSAPEPSAPPEVDLTGQVLGEFRLLHRIGRGGMGQVYLAEQIALKRKVALKLLEPEMAANERSLQRFKFEAENVARATHANIVQIYTIGKTGSINYIALEYVDGKNLREFIEKKGTPELSVGLHIMAQVAAALQRASELGVIHRDVKPENIMLTKKAEVKVADFGLSRCFEESNKQNLTKSGVVMGTPLYMSPEQVEQKPVDSRTDIYSFGVTCYYMFVGHPPFRGNNPFDVAYQHVHKEPQPLAEIRPDLPVELCRIIHRMMAKSPDDRYQTAREVVRDIHRLRESLNLGAIAAISMSATSLGSVHEGLSSSATQTWPGRTTSTPVWLGAAALVATLLAALAGSMYLGWLLQPTVPHKDNANIPVPAHPEEPAAVHDLFTVKEREKELRSLVEKYAQPAGQLEENAALTHSVELALFYLKEKKFEEADRFFNEIRRSERKLAVYRLLGRLGHAMVLAFKDDYAESNKEFLQIVGDFEKMETRFAPGSPKLERPKLAPLKDEIDAYKLLWKNNPPMREMAAKALNYNHANGPNDFPAAKLDVYRFPPRPTLKAAPPT